jgi:hypothetical protein
MKDVRRESVAKGDGRWRLKEFGRKMLAKGDGRWRLKDVRRDNREKHERRENEQLFFRVFSRLSRLNNEGDV